MSATESTTTVDTEELEVAHGIPSHVESNWDVKSETHRVGTHRRDSKQVERHYYLDDGDLVIREKEEMWNYIDEEWNVTMNMSHRHALADDGETIASFGEDVWEWAANNHYKLHKAIAY